MKRFQLELGYMNPLIIPLVVVTVAMVGLAGFGIWAYMGYTDHKNNTDSKIQAAVAEAKKEQSDEDEAKFAEREKEPTRQFVGPDDLGRVQLNYPKTWSAYVAKSDVNAGIFEVYFHPSVVPPTESKTPYALRVSVENKAYDTVLASYQTEVKKGDLKSEPVAIEGQNGNRLDGNFSKTVQGSMVIFKVRDKTLKVYTESTTFRNDFDNIILKSLKFNP